MPPVNSPVLLNFPVAPGFTPTSPALQPGQREPTPFENFLLQGGYFFNPIAKPSEPLPEGAIQIFGVTLYPYNVGAFLFGAIMVFISLARLSQQPVKSVVSYTQPAASIVKKVKR